MRRGCASRQFNFALSQQDAVEQGAEGRKALVQELTQERIGLNEQMGLIGQQLDAMGPPNGNVAATVRAISSSSAQPDRGRARDRHRSAQSAPDARIRPAMAQKMSARSGAAARRRISRRSSISASSSTRRPHEYAELNQDDTIKNALTALGTRGQARPEARPLTRV